jgi:hypothetical protein
MENAGMDHPFPRPGPGTAVSVLAVSLILGACSHASPAYVPTGSDFEARCRTEGVVRCFGFDSIPEVRPYLHPIWGTQIVPDIDSTTRASGAGSLRFTIPPRSGPDTSGHFEANFADDLSVQFGEGEEFFVQWRQRFSPEMLDTFYQGGLGWKQAVIGEGDRPGFYSPGCTQLELVVSNTSQAGYPQMYHSCGGKDGQYEPLYQRRFPPYVADEWMTFQVQVRIGHWYQNDFNYRGDSLIRLWVARAGSPPELAIDLSPEPAMIFGVPVPFSGTGYDLANNNPAAKYGKILLTPYHTGKSDQQDHPTAYTWYDELIISRRRIPDP